MRFQHTRIPRNRRLESAQGALRLVAALKNDRAQIMRFGVGAINGQHLLQFLQSLGVVVGVIGQQQLPRTIQLLALGNLLRRRTIGRSLPIEFRERARRQFFF